MNNNKFIIATGIGVLTLSSLGIVGMTSAANTDATTSTIAQSTTLKSQGEKRGGF